MKTTAMMNLKGGVAKTITAVNMAAILATKHGKRVLLIDADHQGNSSSFFSTDTDCTTLREILTAEQEPYWADNVQGSGIERLDIIPSDMTLADLDMGGADTLSEPNRCLYRLRDFLLCVAEDDAYDHVIIDLPPSFSTAAKASLLAADEVIVPMKIDAFSLSGLLELLKQIGNMRKINPALRLVGALVTMYRNAQNTNEAVEFLRKSKIPVFHQTIRWTDRLVDESTFAHRPLYLHSPRCAAAKDYAKFVMEYLGGEKHGEKTI